MPKRKLLADVSWRQLRRIAQRSELSDERPSSIENLQSASESIEDDFGEEISNLGEGSCGQNGEHAGKLDLEDNLGDDLFVDDQCFYDDAHNASLEQDGECGRTDCEPAAEEADERKSFMRRLADWACRYKIRLKALTALLLILCLCRT